MADGPGEASRRRTGDRDAVWEAFEQFPVALVAFAGPEHRVTAVNQAYRALVGRTGFVGRTVREVLPEVEGQQLVELLDRVYATGEPEVGREWRLQLDDGDGALRESWVDFVVSARRGPDGAVTGVLGSVTDVTEQVRRRHEAQARAADAEQRFAAARDVMATLQRELLPPGLPVLPAVQIAASYLLADAGTTAGGDWFDALALPDGRVVLVVGDVVGHGVVASATMGQLRAVLGERLRATDGDVTAALAAVDRVADHLPGARAATVCAAVLDPADGALTYATAGHPPPLLVPAAGEARYLSPTGGGPLGTGAAFPAARARLAVGDLLLVYSDGVLERPGRDPRSSGVELARVAADTAAGRSFAADGESPAERVCTQALELLVRATGHADDITLLATGRREPVADLALTAPAEPRTLAAVRRELRGWLRALGAGEDTVSDVAHAVGELVTNAVEHAYPDDGPRRADPDAVRLDATLSPTGVLRLAVHDRGRWLDPRLDPDATPRDPGPLPGADRGRGLEMSTALIDALTVDRGPDRGTTATVEHRLTRPARLLTTVDLFADAPARDADRDDPTLLLVLDEPPDRAHEGPRVRVDGPVDAVTADQLHTALVHRTRGGTRPLTVDLTGVTHLGSAGVAALFAARRSALRGADGEPALVLHAPVGSVADHVLTLVGLPHVTGS
ncbi:SpoIIE family protein phosphatase [Actinomycetospora sp. CA-101289]|uniref:SpoIIE family protein phosphatase n=1 Tax=Actinomycetospora sp. CA-101289 TaxID=3239893 RepID=UPI003D982101